MIGEPEDLWLLATDAGLRFHRAPQGPDHRSPRRQDGAERTRERARAGAGAVPSPDSLVAVRQPAKAAARLSGGGGCPRCRAARANKLYDIPGKKAAARVELMTAAAVVPPKASLVLWSGEQHKGARWRDLQDYVGERAQRGAVLRRGLAAQYRPAGNAAAAAQRLSRRKSGHGIQGCRNPIANRNDSH